MYDDDDDLLCLQDLYSSNSQCVCISLIHYYCHFSRYLLVQTKQALEDFFILANGNPLMLNKWFAVQSGTPSPGLHNRYVIC